MGRDTFHYTKLLKVLSSLALSTSREEASTASLGNLFQCLITFTVTNNAYLKPSFNILLAWKYQKRV